MISVRSQTIPRYTILIAADHTGIARQIEFDAATPWLALEKTYARYQWLAAEVFEGGRSLGKVERADPAMRGLWRLLPERAA